MPALGPLCGPGDADLDRRAVPQPDLAMRTTGRAGVTEPGVAGATALSYPAVRVHADCQTPGWGGAPTAALVPRLPARRP